MNKKILHEKNRYIDETFPFGLYTVTKASVFPTGRGYLDLHWHEELQFTLVISGQVHMKIGDLSYSLDTGEAIFINSGMLHITTYMSEDAKYISINFLAKLLCFFNNSLMERKYVKPFIANFALTALHFHKGISWHDDVLALLNKLYDEMKKSYYLGQEYELSIYAVRIWKLVIGHIEVNHQPESSWIKKQKRMQEMLTYIHEHYDEEIRLEDIAGIVHISIGECGRFFKNMLGTTPNEYLIDYRIKMSLEALIAKDATVAEIATQVGFNHVSYFIQCFKKKTGITPKQYQKNYKL